MMPGGLLPSASEGDGGQERPPEAVPARVRGRLVSATTRAWAWLSEGKNLDITKWLVGGLAVLVGLVAAHQWSGEGSKVLQLTPDAVAALRDSVVPTTADDVASAKANGTGPLVLAQYEETTRRRAQADSTEQARQDAEAILNGISQLSEVIRGADIAKATSGIRGGSFDAASDVLRGARNKGTSAGGVVPYILGRISEFNLRFGEASQYYQEAVSIDALNPEFVERAATLLSASGRYEAASSLYDRAIEGLRRKGSNATNVVVRFMANRAESLRAAGNLLEARAEAESALVVAEATSSRDDECLAITYNNLGGIYGDLGAFGKAEGFYLRALDAYERTSGRESVSYAVVLNNMSYDYRLLGRFDDAERNARKAVGIVERVRGPYNPANATALSNLARARAGVGRLAEALEYVARARRLVERSFGKDTPRYARVLIAEAAVRMEANTSIELANAQNLCTEALAIQLKLFDGMNANLIETYGLRGMARQRLGDAGGEEDLLSAIAIADSGAASRHPELVAIMAALGDARAHRGDAVAAQQAYARGLGIAQAFFAQMSPEVARLVERLQNETNGPCP
jgi:tetratricopeptide (TPR) repeat protein